MKNQIIPSANFHLWEPCNFRCGFCFATFKDVKQTVLPKGHLPKEQVLQVVAQLADFGFEKINFAGGEPTLCPWLFELAQLAKSKGMTTAIISNGSRMDDAFLKKMQGALDWIGISVDSLLPETNRLSGRFGGRLIPDRKFYETLCSKIKDAGYLLKINTVVHRLNKDEVINNFIDRVKPLRWKILQMLPVKGQNDQHAEKFAITIDDYFHFLRQNIVTNHITETVKEDNGLMTSSYIMVDPAGRFFDNAKFKHHYSSPILEVGVEKALKEIEFDTDRFLERGGLYNWSTSRQLPNGLIRIPI